MNPAAPIVLPWPRFSDGLWRVPPGDIYAAYSADQLPRVRAFQHAGAWFTCMSLAGRAFQMTARCYPLIAPGDYHGPEPIERSYQGIEVLFRRAPYRLGAEVLFVANDPTVAEWRSLLRALYADGGAFVSGRSYAELLQVRAASIYASPNEREAQRLELALPDLPKTQTAMRELLARPEAMSSLAKSPQLELLL